MGPQSSWSLESMLDYCYYDACYYLVLKEVYGYVIDMMPVVATYVYGPGSYMVHSVLHGVGFRSTSMESIDFMIIASIGSKGAEVSYKIIGTLISLKGNNVWLDVDYTYGNGRDFSPPAIIGTGFKAEFTAARYRLYR